MASLYEVTADMLREMDNSKLVHLDARCHKVWTHDLQHVANDHRLGKLVQALTEGHRLVVSEMNRRGLRHTAGGPPLGREKMLTTMGSTLWELKTEGMFGVSFRSEDADAIRAGNVSYLILPISKQGLESLQHEDRKLLLVENTKTGNVAFGTATVLDVQPVTSERRQFSARILGFGAAEKALGIAFVPFVNAAPVASYPRCPIWPPGTFKLGRPAIEKCRKAVVSYVFDEDDRALVVLRETPPCAWSPAGGFYRDPGEKLEDVAARKVLEETGVIVESAYAEQTLIDPDLQMVVGRAKRRSVEPKGRHIVATSWQKLDQLSALGDTHPGLASFEYALSSLRAHEAREAWKILDQAPTAITSEFAADLSDDLLRELHETLCDQIATAEKPETVAAVERVIQALNARGL